MSATAALAVMLQSGASALLTRCYVNQCLSTTAPLCP